MNNLIVYSCCCCCLIYLLIVQAASCKQTVFTSLIAIWKRVELQSPVGHLVDNTTIVFNIQTDSMYGDIRIPISRWNYPQLYTKDSITQYTLDELKQLALQKAFSGYTRASESDYICHWDRSVVCRVLHCSICINKQYRIINHLLVAMMLVRYI
jgi:hypothetical protein